MGFPRITYEKTKITFFTLSLSLSRYVLLLFPLECHHASACHGVGKEMKNDDAREDRNNNNNDKA